MNSIDRRLARLQSQIDPPTQEETNRLARIRELAAEIHPEILRLEWHPSLRRPNPHGSYVYFIECNEFIKIGHTTNWPLRFSQLGVASPYPLRVLQIFPGSRSDEQQILLKFIRDRHKGEWFRKSPELLDYIERSR